MYFESTYYGVGLSFKLLAFILVPIVTCFDNHLPELLRNYHIFSLAGNALIKCGETQKRIGTADRELIQTSAINFLTPLKNFIEGDYKTITVS